MNLQDAWTLITDAARGEPVPRPALDEAWGVVHQAVRRCARRKLGRRASPAEAEDIVQEVVVRLLREPETVRRIEVVIRMKLGQVATDRFRRRRREVLREDLDPAATPGRAVCEAEARAEAEDTRRVLESLVEPRIEAAVAAVGAEVPGGLARVRESLALLAERRRGSGRSGPRPDESRARKARRDRRDLRRWLHRRFQAAWTRVPSLGARLGRERPPEGGAILDDPPTPELVAHLDEARPGSPEADCLAWWLAIRTFEHRYAAYRRRTRAGLEP